MIKFDLEKYLSDLEYLVNIDSNASDKQGVEKIATFFKQKFSKDGWFIKEYYANLLLGPCVEISNTQDDQYDLLLLGHMDTVFEVGTAAQRPFKILGGRAYGPGVTDMKSGDLMGAYVIEGMANQQILAPLKVCLALNPEEEKGSKFVRKWLEDLARKSKYVIVLEHARGANEHVQERKGLGRYTFKFQGIAAHAGNNPELGRSAITEMAYWIGKLTDLTDLPEGFTINIGTVAGGEAANIVASEANMVVDLRLVRLEQEKKFNDCIIRLKEHAKAKEVKIEVSGGITRPPMFVTLKTEEFMTLVNSVSENLAMPCKWCKAGGGSDGNFSAALGIPTIDGFGPLGGSAHTDKEYLEVEAIEPAAKLLLEIIKTLRQKLYNL
ncbi:Carboxypeptidase G2 [bioreactor metagenome]|uniref:Carboxypeptidase G2 n=1 Tax=bioreactor metagenome TaxID=1076179 RepID=A0A644WZP1_9ZZZZ|nr:M20 family metallopeptidase [Acidaminococcaceae bacterium]